MKPRSAANRGRWFAPGLWGRKRAGAGWWFPGALGVALGLLGSSCKPEAPADPNLLAMVGTNAIRVEDFKAQMIRRGGLRPDTLDRGALLQEMIEQESLYVKALQAGLDQDPEVQRAYRNLLVGKLKERELNPRLEKVEVTAEDLRRRYDQNRDRYTRPARIRLAVLWLGTGPTLRPEQKLERQRHMEEARTQALGATNQPVAGGFGNLAINYSEDQATRYKGGDVGWIEAHRGHARWSQTVIDAGFALRQIGEISGVITDASGVHLLKLLDRREAAVVPLAEVEAELRQQLLRDQREKTERDFVQEIRNSLPIEVRTQRLASLPVPEIDRKGAGEYRPPTMP